MNFNDYTRTERARPARHAKLMTSAAVHGGDTERSEITIVIRDTSLEAMLRAENSKHRISETPRVGRLVMDEPETAYLIRALQGHLEWLQAQREARRQAAQ